MWFHFFKSAVRLVLGLLLLASPASTWSLTSERFSPGKIRPGLASEEILNRVETSMAGIRDAQARMAFRILVKRIGFPVTVRADYYFKAPDKVKIAFRGLPGLLAGDAPKTVAAATTLTGFRKDYRTLYHARISGIRVLDGQECYYLELVPSEDGNVARTHLWISRANYTVPKLITHYKDGSWIEVRRTYGMFENHLLVRHIDAVMNFVKDNLQANVTADYEGYKLNQGLKDSFF